MADAGWHPEAIGRLTLAQLACLGSERPPGARPAAASLDEALARLDEIAAEESAWSSSPEE